MYNIFEGESLMRYKALSPGNQYPFSGYWSICGLKKKVK